MMTDECRRFAEASIPALVQLILNLDHNVLHPHLVLEVMPSSGRFFEFEHASWLLSFLLLIL